MVRCFEGGCAINLETVPENLARVWRREGGKQARLEGINIEINSPFGVQLEVCLIWPDLLDGGARCWSVYFGTVQ